MTPEIKRLMDKAMAFYKQPPLSGFAEKVWGEALARYSFDAVDRAVQKHIEDTENGKFPPKPADILRFLEGSHKDDSAVAWAKVIKAMKTVGAYRSVAFDDPLIHAAIDGLGSGWPGIGSCLEKDLPFLQIRFETLYRARKSEARAGREIYYPRYLAGIFERDNSANGYGFEPPFLVGDEARALLVMKLARTSAPPIAIKQAPPEEETKPASIAYFPAKKAA